MKNRYYTLQKDKGNYCITLKKNPVLYQYRSVNDYSVRALLHSEIWATVPTAFNDPYDSVFCYNESLIKKEIKKYITKENVDKYVSIILPSNESKIYSITDLVDYIYKQFVGDQVTRFKETLCVSCFSEVYDSEIMWAHYAKNATGFCLAYDSRIIKDVAQQHRNDFLNYVRENDLLGIDLSEYNEDYLESLVPVVYANYKHNRDEQLLDYVHMLFRYFGMLLAGEDFQMAYKWFLKESMDNHYKKFSQTIPLYSTISVKQKVWAYEKEWRIWSYNSNPLAGNVSSKYVKLGYANPSAIYLGEYISEYDEIALKEIAQQRLNIPIYKMKSKMGRNTMKLIPYQI